MLHHAFRQEPGIRFVRQLRLLDVFAAVAVVPRDHLLGSLELLPGESAGAFRQALNDLMQQGSLAAVLVDSVTHATEHGSDHRRAEIIAGEVRTNVVSTCSWLIKRSPPEVSDLIG